MLILIPAGLPGFPEPASLLSILCSAGGGLGGAEPKPLRGKRDPLGEAADDADHRLELQPTAVKGDVQKCLGSRDVDNRPSKSCLSTATSTFHAPECV